LNDDERNRAYPGTNALGRPLTDAESRDLVTKSWPSTSLAASTGLTASAKCDDGGPVLRVRVGRHLDVALGQTVSLIVK
jgi:hypothetical protein